MPDATRETLIRILKEKALEHREEPLVLRSGELSHDFVDAKRGLAEWADLELACRVVVDTLGAAGIEFDTIGGPTMGADALAVGIAAVSNKRWFFIRSAPKGRGTNRLIEGDPVGPGSRVLLVEDAVSTGGSVQEAYERVVDTGAEVVAAATLIDRGEIARAFFDQRGVPYFPMATYGDLGIAPIGGGTVSASP